jgi:type IV pilus assembly protein PilB
MIGEIRDTETAKIAVEAALTGHFVLSTLHTNDAASAVTRLGEMGVEPFLTPRLGRSGCPAAYPDALPPLQAGLYHEARRAASHGSRFPLQGGGGGDHLYKAKGCLSCNNTGYRGRRGVYEFLQVTEEIQQLILSGSSNHKIKAVAVEQG